LAPQLSCGDEASGEERHATASHPEPLPTPATGARHGSFSHSTLTTGHTCEVSILLIRMSVGTLSIREGSTLQMPNGRGARRGIRAGGPHRDGFLGEEGAGEGLKESAGEKYRGSDDKGCCGSGGPCPNVRKPDARLTRSLTLAATTPSANPTRKGLQAFILPAMPLAEALETTRLHRVAGRTGARPAWVPTRPCRAPTRPSRMLD
jgi:hypothetical protein